MRKLLLAAAVLLGTAIPALAQSGCQYIAQGAVLTAAQWQFCFQQKLNANALSYVPVNKAGDTMLGRLTMTPATTLAAGLNIAPGTVPSSPNNGDVWTTSAGMFVRINGATVGPLASATSSGFAGTSPITVSFPAGVVTYAFNFAVANIFTAGQTISPTDASTVPVTGTLLTLNNNTASPRDWSNPAGEIFPLQISGADGAPTGIMLDAYNSFPVFDFRRANGTAASPTALQTGDVGGIIGFKGYDGGSTATGWSRGGAQIGVKATEDWSATANGSLWDFVTTPNGSPAGTATRAVLRLDQDRSTTAWGKLNVYAGQANSPAVGVAPPTPISTSLLQLIGANSTEGGITINTYNAIPRISLLRSNGTQTVPTAILSGDVIGSILAGGYDGATLRGTGNGQFIATENWNTGALGTAWRIFVVPNGSTTATQALQVHQSSSLTVGYATDPSAAGIIGALTGFRINNAAASGNLLQGNGTNFVSVAMSGDAAIASGGALTLTSVISAGGPTGSATVAPIITYDVKGRLTAVSSATITPAIGSITGLGTGIAAALAINTGSAGAPILFNGPAGTPTSITLTNGTGLPTTGLTGTLQAAQEPAHTGDVTNTAGSLALTIAPNAVTLAKMATQATNTVLGNATSGTAVPTALAVGSCSTAASALNWTTNTGFGCNTAITAAAAPISGITGMASGASTFLITPSSANFAALLTDEAGSGVVPFAAASSGVPTFTFGGGSTGMTFSTQTYNKYKIGNLVYETFVFIFTAKGSSTGSAATSLSETPTVTGVCALQVNNLAASAITQIQASFTSGSSTVNLQRYAAGAGTAMADTDFANNSVLRMTCSYTS